MKIQDQDSKDQLIKRLRRIEGQLRGIQGMLAEERDCREITQQLAAVSSALRAASRSFFQDYAALCLADVGGKSSATSQELLEELLSLLEQTP